MSKLLRAKIQIHVLCPFPLYFSSVKHGPFACFVGQAPVCKSSQVKSYSPGEHEGSAHCKPQGPARWGRVVGMHAAAPAALWAAWDECTCGRCAVSSFLSLNCGFDSPFRSRNLGRLGTPAPRAKSRGGIPPGLLWSRRTVRSPHNAVWKVEDEGLASPRLQRSYPAPGACNQWVGLASVVLANLPTAPDHTASIRVCRRAGRTCRACCERVVC